jgi:hypothetical protein
MASDLTFSEKVAVAQLVFEILAVLFVVPFLVVAFGFFPDSAFARRVHPSNDAILAQLHLQKRELKAIHKTVTVLRTNSDLELEWFDTLTDTVIENGNTLKEKMD